LASYVLVIGNGKSGTKRVLKTLDLSPRTHCRMEPNELSGSPFAELPSPNVFAPDTHEELEKRWDSVADWTRRRMGERDEVPGPPKVHQYELSRRLQLYRVFKHNRLRRVLANLYPAVGGAEWPPPRWWVDRDELDRALPVFKLGPLACYVTWLLRMRPEAKIVSVIRHPAGFLNSYCKRFLPISNPRNVHRDNLDRLEAIAGSNPEWRERFGAISDLTLEEAELWFWRYANETTLAAGREADAFISVEDTEMAFAPVATAKRVYDHCELPWEEATERYLASRAEHWAERTAPWRAIIPPEHVRIVERVLDESPLRHLWDDDHRVSLEDYVF
jgi:hypothetical protein